MPNLGGVFDLFSDLDTISASELLFSSQGQTDHHTLENHLARRILYPHTIAVTKQELDLDYAIFAIAVRRHPEIFFDSKQNRMIIQESIIYYLPPLTRLISTILQNIPDTKVTQIWLISGTNQRIIGSCISKEFINNLHLNGEIQAIIGDKQSLLIPNQLNLISLPQKETTVKFNNSQLVTVIGSEVGLFIDLREGTL